MCWKNRIESSAMEKIARRPAIKYQLRRGVLNYGDVINHRSGFFSGLYSNRNIALEQKMYFFHRNWGMRRWCRCNRTDGPATLDFSRALSTTLAAIFVRVFVFLNIMNDSCVSWIEFLLRQPITDRLLNGSIRKLCVECVFVWNVLFVSVMVFKLNMIINIMKIWNFDKYYAKRIKISYYNRNMFINNEWFFYWG